MPFIKQITLAATLLIASISMQAKAALILDIDLDSGQLLGAQNVEVNGSLYDVQFLDGSCNSLFDNCSSFAFTQRDDAEAAATALLEQVFVDNGSSLFDQNPALTAGCNDSSACGVIVPFELANITFVNVEFAFNNSGSSADSVFGGAPARTLDFSTVDQAVYAVFTQVPEPGALSLFALGMIGMALRSKRSR